MEAATLGEMRWIKVLFLSVVIATLERKEKGFSAVARCHVKKKSLSSPDSSSLLSIPPSNFWEWKRLNAAAEERGESRMSEIAAPDTSKRRGEKLDRSVPQTLSSRASVGDISEIGNIPPTLFLPFDAADLLPGMEMKVGFSLRRSEICKCESANMNPLDANMSRDTRCDDDDAPPPPLA